MYQAVLHRHQVLHGHVIHYSGPVRFQHLHQWLHQLLDQIVVLHRYLFIRQMLQVLRVHNRWD